jgi:hypothetical protein
MRVDVAPARAGAKRSRADASLMTKWASVSFRCLHRLNRRGTARFVINDKHLTTDRLRLWRSIVVRFGSSVFCADEGWRVPPPPPAVWGRAQEGQARRDQAGRAAGNR